MSYFALFSNEECPRKLLIGVSGCIVIFPTLETTHFWFKICVMKVKKWRKSINHQSPLGQGMARLPWTWQRKITARMLSCFWKGRKILTSRPSIQKVCLINCSHVALFRAGHLRFFSFQIRAGHCIGLCSYAQKLLSGQYW